MQLAGVTGVEGGKIGERKWEQGNGFMGKGNSIFESNTLQGLKSKICSGKDIACETLSPV